MKTCLHCYYKWRNVARAGHIITSCHEDRAYKRCLCCVCGEIHECTPSFDFYTTDDHGEGLVCERCFHEYLGHRLNAEKWVADLNAQPALTPGRHLPPIKPEALDSYTGTRDCVECRDRD